ncbi:MAG: hypothetical protein MJ220_01215 [Bacilli bacterium]|nr:hypothetical protein [Bacilli bacterium]
MKIEKYLFPFISVVSIAIGVFFCVWYYPSVLIDSDHTIYGTMLALHIALSMPCFWVVYVFTDLWIRYLNGGAFTQRTCALLKASSVVMLADSVMFVALTSADIALSCISNVIGNVAILLFGLMVSAALFVLRNHVRAVIKDKEDLEGTV